MRLLACCFIVIFASSLANDAVARDTPDRPTLLAEVSLDDVLRLLGEHSPWVAAEMVEAWNLSGELARLLALPGFTPRAIGVLEPARIETDVEKLWREALAAHRLLQSAKMEGEAARILDIDRRTLYRRLEVASGSEDLP